VSRDAQKHTLGEEPLTTRVAVVEGDSRAAEMLHIFFRLMEVRAIFLSPEEGVTDTVCGVGVQAVLLDLDLPDLRGLDYAREIHRRAPLLPVIFTSISPRALPTGEPVVRKPVDPLTSFEDLLHLMELLLG